MCLDKLDLSDFQTLPPLHNSSRADASVEHNSSTTPDCLPALHCTLHVDTSTTQTRVQKHSNGTCGGFDEATAVVASIVKRRKATNLPSFHRPPRCISLSNTVGTRCSCRESNDGYAGLHCNGDFLPCRNNAIVLQSSIILIVGCTINKIIL